MLRPDPSAGDIEVEVQAKAVRAAGEEFVIDNFKEAGIDRRSVVYPIFKYFKILE